MSKKKILLIVVIISLVGFGIYHFTRSTKSNNSSEETTESAIDQSSTDEDAKVSDATPTPAPDYSQAKTVKPLPKIATFDEYLVKVKEVFETNVKEVEECENQIDHLFGNAMKENDPEFLNDEGNVTEMLDQFKALTLTPPSTGELIRLLANDMSKQLTDENFPKSTLAELRPCRPLEKVTFINSLMLAAQQKKWSSETKAQVKNAIFEYFNKELSDDSNLLHVNLQATLLESMVDAGFVSEKFEEKVVDLRDSMEDEQDDILEQIEGKPNEEGQPTMPFTMINQEFQKAVYYRERLVNLIHEIQGAE